MKRIAVWFTGCALGWGTAAAQTQKGSDIDGLAEWAQTGSAVSMPDASTIAVGTGNAGLPGHVQVHAWDGNQWEPLGEAVVGTPGSGEMFGQSVSMPSPGAFAASAPYRSGGGAVRVLAWNGAAWTQQGTDVAPGGGNLFGHSLSMPTEGTFAAASESEVTVFEWNGQSWVPKGAPVAAELGRVSMPNDVTLAIGEPGALATQGRVRVYRWNGLEWVQAGMDLVGDGSSEQFGFSVSMGDENTVAVGAPYEGAGRTRAFTWDGSSWAQKGDVIFGEYLLDRAGYSVDMGDANSLAIGTPFSSGSNWNWNETGHVRVYHWQANSWVKVNYDLDGELSGDRSGEGLSMPEPAVVAIGGPLNDGGGSNAGHVRVYDLALPEDASSVPLPQFSCTAYPNPSAGIVHLTEHVEGTYALYNAAGAVAAQGRIATVLDFRSCAGGNYVLHLESDAGVTRVPVVLLNARN